MARKLFTAILRSASGIASVDAEAGIIRGVKLMTLGKLARFAGEEGKPKQVTITNEHISALLSHAGNRSIPIHDSHEWFDAQDKPNADSVEMNARIGALKAFRRDDAGNLIADAHLNKAKPAALDLLWGAEANPEDNCFSVVFNYLKDDPNCIPQNFRAGDRVPNGAATTALFSADNNPKSIMMTDEDKKEVRAFLAELLNEPETKTALLKLAPDPKADAKAIEDAVKAALETHKVALLAEAKIAGEAGATQLIGTGKFIKQSDADTSANEVESAIAGYIASGAKNRGVAILRLANDKPALYNSAVAAGKL